MFVAALAAIACHAGALSSQTPPALEHFTVRVDGEPLMLWARRPTGATRTILLIHGRTWSARPDFDLQVAGEQKSVLEELAARGYAAYALDLRGYGASPRDATGWDTPRRSALDVDSILSWIAVHQPVSHAPILLGWSNGALVSQLAAQLHPERVSLLVLYGYPWNPDDAFIDDDESDPPAREHTTPADASSDFITPNAISQRTIDAYVAAAVASDPVRSDWRRYAEYNTLNGAHLHMPVLLLQGERDPALTHEALARVFAKIASQKKEWITLRGGDHAALLERTRPSFIDAVTGFVSRATP
ncbi:MAG TPA: alpha/beta fold hydrolase [Gemmatimonadales bacterium]|nr:alpha/beta fold hydrolase [Gemmatimonadales bacterium]